MMFDEERVVLLGETGLPIGTALKSGVHTADTPLHLAFSCYLFNELGEVLVTRRALTKRTWPGVWTNSFCGHPSPDESPEIAIVRRAQEELGAEIFGIELVLPNFRYRATDASGVVENEICPVYVARLGSSLTPHPDEIAEWAWVSPLHLAESLERTPFTFSPWMVRQLPELFLHENAFPGERR